MGLQGEWRLVSAAGAYDATGTKATGGGWVSGLVSYKALSSAPATTAPTAPGTPAVAVSPGGAQLAWAASSDAGGVAYYKVHRSVTSGFTPGPGNEIGQTTQLTYTDNGDGSGNGLAAGSYFYKLVAIDQAGNASAASAQSAAATVVADAQLPTGAFTTPTPATTTTVSGNVTLAVAAAAPAPTGNMLAYGFDPAGFRSSRTLNGVTTRYLLGGLIETLGTRSPLVAERLTRGRPGVRAYPFRVQGAGGRGAARSVEAYGRWSPAGVPSRRRVRCSSTLPARCSPPTVTKDASRPSVQVTSSRSRST